MKLIKRSLLIIATLFIGVSLASAQSNKKAVIAFEKMEHDFGVFNEADGPVSHTFTLVNKGDAPLVITRVITSCGCTTPKYTEEPIAPGKKGEVVVTYDPEGRPYPFRKTISVYSNGSKTPMVLTIEGEVVGK